ncbi:MAG TPA: ATP-binding protein [Terriglobales bacterium]|nr:ATP-binding protein [Terriglobales bacterium]
MSTSFPSPHDPVLDPDHPLARAFRSFTEAAGSLERTYGQLQGQVAHLRRELEVTNRNLNASVEENRRMRERLRNILEGLPCGVLVVEKEGAISALNPEAVRLAGGNVATVDALPPALLSALETARTSGEEREAELHLLPPRAGAHEFIPVWVAVRHAWLERHGESATSVFILRDISAAKNLEKESESLRRKRALVEMSALLAHEIRNPLGSLELFAGLLAESGLEGESRRWIEHIQAGLRALSSTVNNVLDLHNEPPAQRAHIDAGCLLDWAYEFLMPLARQAGVEIQVINGLGGVSIEADRHLLEQVLLNLALNAFRFMPGGGWFSIRGINRAAKGVEIEVHDTGPGIAEQDLSRIFDVGFTTRAGSSGLGLAVCRRILAQHGGQIAVESRHGHGATFRLTLPAAEAQSPSREDAGGLSLGVSA